MMKKLILRSCVLLTVLTLMGIAMPASAQQTETKKSLMVDYFFNPSSISDKYISTFRNSVISHIQERKRVIVIDAESQAALKQERERRESSSASAEGDMERMKVMSQLGANYILVGAINSISTKSETDKDGKTTWKATCNYTIKAIDPTNGTTLASRTSDYSASGKKTEEEAKTDAAYSSGIFIDELLETIAPLYGTILEVNKVKKDEAKEVYISLGSDHGVDTDTWFGVYVTRTIAGRESNKKIGQLKVSAVEGGDISLCKVRKGGKELKSALDQKQNVILKSEYVSTLFGIKLPF